MWVRFRRSSAPALLSAAPRLLGSSKHGTPPSWSFCNCVWVTAEALPPIIRMCRKVRCLIGLLLTCPRKEDPCDLSGQTRGARKQRHRSHRECNLGNRGQILAAHRIEGDDPTARLRSLSTARRRASFPDAASARSIRPMEREVCRDSRLTTSDSRTGEAASVAASVSASGFPRPVMIPPTSARPCSG